MKEETGQEPARKRRPARVCSAKEKSRAVLALWSGRRKAAVLCRELGVSWTVLNSWEQRALAGMLTALDPRWKQGVGSPQELPERVERLLVEATGAVVKVEAQAN